MISKDQTDLDFRMKSFFDGNRKGDNEYEIHTHSIIFTKG